jgi:hypothetical protein
VEYVLVDKQRATPELRRFARSALNLDTVYDDERYELLKPSDAPRCEAGSPTRRLRSRGRVGALVAPVDH